MKEKCLHNSHTSPRRRPQTQATASSGTLGPAQLAAPLNGKKKSWREAVSKLTGRGSNAHANGSTHADGYALSGAVDPIQIPPVATDHHPGQQQRHHQPFVISPSVAASPRDSVYEPVESTLPPPTDEFETLQPESAYPKAVTGSYPRERYQQYKLCGVSMPA